MGWELSVGVVVGVSTATISGVVVALAWPYRRNPMAKVFIGLTVTLAAWSLLYGLQLGYTTLAAQLAWWRVTLGVAGFVPTLWLLFALAYTNRDSWLTRPRVTVFLAEPVAFLLLCLTNPVHGLVWRDASLVSTVVGAVPALEFAAGYAIHIAYAYLAVAVGLVLLVFHATKVAATYQKQVLLLVAGAIPPFFSHIAFTLDVSPIPALDLTPFVFAVTGLLFAFALFRFELLKLAPIARNQALEEVGDGLVVINTDGEIVDLFGVASTVLEPTPSVGDPITSVFSERDLSELDGDDLTTAVDGDRRSYQFQVSRLTDHLDRHVGTVLILRDVTGLRASRRRLSVNDRVLRHNLRNDMTVIHGYSELLEARLDGRDAEDARTIRETVERLLDLTEKARQIADVHAADVDDSQRIDIVEHIHSVVEDLEATYPDAEFRLDAPRSLRTTGVVPETFRVALHNVLDNAVRHNGSPDPHVEISVRADDDSSRIEIRDDGPGIPEIERDALDAGFETQLEHSQGLGLWLTHSCVTTWGGELTVEPTDCGTTVTVTLPER